MLPPRLTFYRTNPISSWAPDYIASTDATASRPPARRHACCASPMDPTRCIAIRSAKLEPAKYD